MIQNIIKDKTFLAKKAEPASPEDLPVAQDLLDTLAAHKDGCVGMAANMICDAERTGTDSCLPHGNGYVCHVDQPKSSCLRL